MEAHEIYEVVEGAWPFTPEKYPVLRSCTYTEANVFILSHILKHQSGTLADCWEVIIKKGTAKDGKSRDCIYKLLFNSIRFAITLRVKEHKLISVLEAWNKPSETRLPAVSHEDTMRIFSEEAVGRVLKDLIEDYIDLVLRSAKLLEPPDHGGRLLTAQLKLNATRSMSLAAQLARYYNFTQSDFEEWLSENYSL